jgi:hypothetical protein
MSTKPHPQLLVYLQVQMSGILALLLGTEAMTSHNSDGTIEYNR